MTAEPGEWDFSNGSASPAPPARRRGPRWRNWLLGIGFVGVGVAVFVSCFVFWPQAPDVWKKITVREFDSGETAAVIYRANISDDDATRLSEFLERMGFFHKPVTIYLERRTSGWERPQEALHVSFFGDRRAFEDDKVVQAFDQVRSALANDVFPGRPVVVELCEQEVQIGVNAGVTKTIVRTLR
jgi:hypothetical protein